MNKYLVGLLAGLQFLCSLVVVDAQSSKLFSLSFDDFGGFFFSNLYNQGENQTSFLNPSNRRPATFYIRVNGHSQAVRLVKRSFAASNSTKIVGPEFQTDTISFKPLLFRSPKVDGLLGLRYDVKNESGASIIVSMVLILDTWFGEASGVHFVLLDENSRASITTETTLNDSNTLRLLLSSNSDANNVFSMLFPSQGSDFSGMTKVTLANYEKLIRSPFTVETGEGSTFNLLPFSINDSAIRVFFGDIIIPPGGSVSRYIILSDKISLEPKTVENIKILFTEDAAPAIVNQTGNAGNPNTDTSLTSRTSVDEILKEIDQLQSRPNYSQAELERLLRRLQGAQR